MVYTLRYFLFKMQCFIIPTYLVPMLFSFYVQGVLKLNKWFQREKVKYLRQEKIQDIREDGKVLVGLYWPANKYRFLHITNRITCSKTWLSCLARSLCDPVERIYLRRVALVLIRETKTKPEQSSVISSYQVGRNTVSWKQNVLSGVLFTEQKCPTSPSPHPGVFKNST